MDEPKASRNWKKSTIGLVCLVILLLVGTIGFGLLYNQDQDSIRTLTRQVDSLQFAAQSLNSLFSSLQTEEANQTSYLSLYEKNFPVLRPVLTGLGGSDICLELTDVSPQALIVPASGVKVIGPNGSQYFPTPGHQITFSVFSTNECLGSTIPGNQTSATVPSGGTIWIVISDTSLEGLGASGNYILTFNGVTNTSGAHITVDPVWISWTAPSTGG